MEIAQASQLYQDIKSGKSRVKFDAGEIIEPSVGQFFVRKFNHASIKTKLITLVLTAFIFIISIAFYSNRVLTNLHTFSQENMHYVEQ
ncbi:MAG TPA: hypothetical protein DF614_03460, partial [Methylococcaceae bacterium]|nr:hypothetical protein [Methylococcaceae bacterium]